MTPEQRVGQLFLLGIGGDLPSSAEKKAIQSYHLGSVWLIHKRTNGTAGIAKLSAQVQTMATATNTGGVRFFVGADQEGGRIQRLNGTGFSTIPSALQQGALAPEVLEADAAVWGRELKAAGVNLNFAPVMDVVPPGTDAQNKPIGYYQREYGHDPATVSSHGAAIVRGMSRAGIATTLKHFPGLGRVAGNTDTASGVVDPITTADDPYLDSFRAGIEAGAPFVMVSSATYPAIDPDHPAVFSSIALEDLLRDRLGFEGVIVSDDLGSAAAVAAVSPGDRAVQFISAGGDLIVVAGTGPATAMAQALLAKANGDPVFSARVDAAALRVLEAKEAYGLLPCS